MMIRRRLKHLSEGTLRAWLRALEACPQLVPFVVDLRIAVRNELWLRSTEEERRNAWFVNALTEWNA